MWTAGSHTRIVDTSSVQIPRGISPDPDEVLRKKNDDVLHLTSPRQHDELSHTPGYPRYVLWKGDAYKDSFLCCVVWSVCVAQWCCTALPCLYAYVYIYIYTPRPVDPQITANSTHNMSRTFNVPWYDTKPGHIDTSVWQYICGTFFSQRAILNILLFSYCLFFFVYNIKGRDNIYFLVSVPCKPFDVT